jgi:hypothetical protein
VSTARDPIFHKNAKAAALRDLQLLRKPVGAQSRKRSTRKIPKMMAPAECPIMLTSCDSSMPDIDQLESIPIGNDPPSSKSYSGQAQLELGTSSKPCDGHEAYDYHWLERKAQDGVGAI